MERIKKALQRAKEERADDFGVDSELGELGISRIGSKKIDYKNTRVLKVREKILLRNRIVTGQDKNRSAAAYKVLRTQVLKRMQAEKWKALGITSAAPTEGKSLTAANLAVSVAKDFRNTVLLADVDFRNPSISSMFDIGVSEGLSDHLLKGVPLKEVLFNPDIERLVVLPAGSTVKNSSEMVRSPEMQALIHDLKSRYVDRFLFFDLPPLLIGDDALNFLPYIDCVLLVIEDGKSHPGEVSRAVELLHGVPLIGSVLNKSESKKKKYYSQYY